MKNDLITLVSSTKVKNSKGIYVQTEVENEVFCEVSSVSAQEFFNGGQNGLKPAYRFKINKLDYNKETVIKYDSERYSVYRTFVEPHSDDIELYTEQDIGS